MLGLNEGHAMKTTLRDRGLLPNTIRFHHCLGAILIVFSLLAAAGCSKKTESVVVRGSNTFGEELAPRLIAEFRKAHPEVKFDTEFKGTSYGLGALMVSRCDIAAAS